MKSLKLTLFILVLNVISFASLAQSAPETPAPTEEKKPTFTLSGSVDAYLHSGFGNQTKSPNTSFANLNGFALGMVNLIGAYDGEKAGFKADLVYGPRGFDAVFANTYTGSVAGKAPGQRIINQLYAYYKISKKTTINLGQFNTFYGYEVISPTGNFHYSTSYMFSWGPFNHTGLRADFDLGGGFVGKLAIMNPTDLVEFNPVNTYTLGGQFGYASDGGSLYFNVLYGDQDGILDKNNPTLPDGASSQGSTLALDITAGLNVSDKFYLGVNTTYRTKSKGETFNGTNIVDTNEEENGFLGFALYPKLTLSESFALGLRAEYFAISKNYLYDPTNGVIVIGRDAQGSGNVTAFTLSGNYKVEGLTIIPELRFDSASENTFFDKDYKATKTLPTANLAFVYKF
jgi:Putative beta-barrel porin-2, OmpL-like. bbp2